MKKLFKLIILFLVSSTLVSCWNYVEVNDFYIVAGAAIDKGENGELLLTVELVEIDEYSQDQSFDSLIVKSTGEGIMDASRSLIRVVAKKLYWGHAATLILSQDIAEEGLASVINWIIKDQEPSPFLHVYISKEETASEILKTKALASSLKSFELEIASRQANTILRFPILRAFEIGNGISTPHNNMVLPTIRNVVIEGEDTPYLSGGAIFHQAKLQGFIDEKDIADYLFIINQVDRGLLILDLDPTGEIKGTFEIHYSNTRVKPDYSKENLGFNINISLHLAISQLNTNIYSSTEGRSRLEEDIAQALEAEIENFIKMIQREYGMDIFGFGSIIYHKNPKLWKEIEDQWSELFKDLEANVDIEVEIMNNGHLLEEIEVK